MTEYSLDIGDNNWEVIFMLSDKILTCKDCGSGFAFTVAEQEFYAEKGFENEPGRCPECRSARKAQLRGSRGYGQSDRQMYPAVCATCGKETSLPFQPNGDRPVYCRDCYKPQSRRTSW